MEDAVPQYVCGDCGYEGDDPVCPHCQAPADATEFIEPDDTSGKYPDELLTDETVEDGEEDEFKKDENL